MCDDDDNEDDDFWKELASDINNGLNDENEYCKEDFDNSGWDSDSESSMLQQQALSASRPTTAHKTKPKKCDDSTSHYHCYCLRSMDFKYRNKNYVGFTVNPERRLKQHNGIRKGGAWKTRRGGRPWEFVVLVSGFPTHKMALQFEWAWQHPGKSLLVRATIGEDAAKTLQRKRATAGQMCMLKTLLELCPDLYDRNQLTLNFLKQDCKANYDSAVAMKALPQAVIAANILSIKEGGKKRRILSAAADAEGLPPAPPLPEAPVVAIRVVSSLSEMPFWVTRNGKRRAEPNNNKTTNQSPQKCKNTTQSSAPVPAEANSVIEIVDNAATTNPEVIETAISINDKESHKGIGDLYRRCCNFEFLGDTSSSEEERETKNDKRTRSTALEDDSDDDSDDDDISFLTASIKDIHMRTFTSDSSSSSQDSDNGDFIDNPKYRVRKEREFEVGWGKVNAAFSTLTNVISIEDDSSHGSVDELLAHPKESATAKIGTLSLEEKINDLTASNNDRSSEDGDNDGDSANTFTSTVSLEEEKLDALMAVEENQPPPPPPRRNDGKTRGPFVACGVTTRRPQTNKTVRSDGSDVDSVFFIGGNKSDGENPSSEEDSSFSSTSMLSPLSLDQATKTKRMSIVDLCTP